MCLAIYNHAKSLLSKEVFIKASRVNSDGAGFGLLLDNGTFLVEKEMNDIDVLYKKYKDARERYPNKPILIHFRMATHGVKTLDNTHPFLIGDHAMLIHNGVITKSAGSYHDEKSDTANFSEMISSLPKGFLNNDLITDMIGEWIGSGNKIVIMDTDGTCLIWGKSAGEVDKEGNWFSNMYWDRMSYNNYWKQGGFAY